MNTERTGTDRGPEATVDTAAMAVSDANATSEDDAEAIAATLRGIAEDGVLTDESVQDALAHLSKVVSTPATRVELSGIELDSARDDASGVMDVPTVAARFDEFAAGVERIESAVADLDGDLRAITERATEVSVVSDLSSAVAVELYELAVERQRIHAEATRLQGAADDLTTEIEAFQRWLGQASVRHDELRNDASELAHTVEALEDSAASLGDADNGSQGDRLQGNAAEAWFDCLLQYRVLALQAVDLRAAALDVDTVDDRLGVDPEDPAHSEVREHAGDLRDRLDETADRLDTLARPEWRERFSAKLAAFEEELASFEPPVEWSAVLIALNEARDHGQ